VVGWLVEIGVCWTLEVVELFVLLLAVAVEFPVAEGGGDVELKGGNDVGEVRNRLISLSKSEMAAIAVNAAYSISISSRFPD
jgi:hypothetical protein